MTGRIYPSASPEHRSRAMAWIAMHKGRRIGRVQSRPGRNTFRIDFGRRWEPRYLYGFRGLSFESQEMAEAILSHIEMEVTKGRELADVLSEFAPEASAESNVESLMGHWLSAFEAKVKAGSRAPRTLREYKRWATPGAHGYFTRWHGLSIWEIDAASIEDWINELAAKGISGKTQRNIVAGFSAFLHWLPKKRRTFRPPEFEWPESEEHIPTTLGLEQQLAVLEAIPKPKRGIFLALATLGARPSEARVLRMRHWTGDEIEIRDGAKDRLVEGEIRGPKKQRAKRNAYVVPLLGQWLDEFVPETRVRWEPEGWLFTNPDAANRTQQWSETALRRTWLRACAHVGVKIGLYEGTKHTLGTLLKSAGEDDRVIAQVFGHADIRSVLPYARVKNATVRAALLRLHGGDEK